MKRIDVEASWWQDEEESESAGHEPVSLRLGYTDDTLYVDGLDGDGRYLALPIEALGRAIAEGAKK